MPECAASGRIWTSKARARSACSIEFSGELFFTGGVIARLLLSVPTDSGQGLNLSTDFVLPFYGAEAASRMPSFALSGCTFNMELPAP